MATITGYQTLTLSGYATISLPSANPATPDATDDIDVDLLSFSSTWQDNAIPTAEASVAVGRDLFAGVLSGIYVVAGNLTVAVPVTIYLQVDIGPNSFGLPGPEDWPDGYFPAFIGKITSITTRTSKERVCLSLSMVHWLDDLRASSTLTRTTHALTPQQLSMLSAFGGGDGVGGGGFVANTGAGEWVTTDTIESDLWGEALGPFLQDICQQDILSDESDDNLDYNKEGLAALNNFEPFITDGYEYGVPLAMAAGPLAGSDELAAAVMEDISQESGESFAMSTLWDKLVAGYGASYEFRIIPMVDRALIAPVIPGQRSPWQIIYAQEYVSIDVTSELPRPVKGVRLFAAGGSSADGGGIPTRPDSAGDTPELAGKYDNPDYPDGMIIYQNARRWAANIAAAANYGEDAVAPHAPRANGIFPGIGNPPAAPLPNDLIDQASELMDVLARVEYIKAALQGRRGSLQGKLRFDIAPGSTVEIRCFEDRFVAAQALALGLAAGINWLYAEVNNVGISVDVEGQSASTTLGLANVRTWAENEVDATSIDQNPLYKEAWNGAPLTGEPEFIPVPNIFFGP